MSAVECDKKNKYYYFILQMLKLNSIDDWYGKINDFNTGKVVKIK